METMRLTCTRRGVGEKIYAPNAIGNGDLSLLVDYRGSTAPATYGRHGVTGIWRAGIRHNRPGWDLVSFGWWEHVVPGAGELADWSQPLHVTEAAASTETVYAGGAAVSTFAYCLLDCNLVVLRVRVTGAETFRMHYHFEPERTAIVPLDDCRTAYQIDTFRQPRGTVAFLCRDEGVRLTRTRGDVWYDCPAGEHVFYLAFDAEAERLAAQGDEASCWRRQQEAWGAYWAESTLPADRLPPQVLRAARTSEYHLRVSSTRWSIPTGIYPPHWQGRYFAFDEFYCLGGLLAAGHDSTARKIPEFRRSHLSAARFRAYHYFKTDGPAARFVWETLEEPGVEGAPGGFWIEHIFHEANIALGAWQCYEHDPDRAFLEETAYPLIRACAEFFRIFYVEEREGGRIIIGRCTDLERLGAARENPFMTTCGAIATFRAAAQAAAILGCDDDLARVWADTAEQLRRWLPKNPEGTAYIPYPGCPDQSIALLSGLYPYPCLPPDDPCQRAGIEAFVATESQFGNMYPVGKSLCTWYAGWKALAFCRLGERDIAKTVIAQMCDDTGCFSEVFEICEGGYHPWFTTGEGTLLQAICEAYASD